MKLIDRLTFLRRWRAQKARSSRITIKPLVHKLDDLLKLEFIQRSSQGSMTQSLVVLFIIALSDLPDRFGQYIVAGLLTVAVAQTLRFLYYLKNRNDEVFLIKRFPLFVKLSYLSGLAWGLSAFMAVHESGPSGIGLYLILACVGAMAATTHTTVLTEQRIYSIMVALPLMAAFFTYDFPRIDYGSIVLFFLYSTYCFVVSAKQYNSIVLNYEQQIRIFNDLRAARDIQRSLLPAPHQKFGPFEIEVLYRPCEDLSGDLFEIQKIQNHVLFYVADVTSHGTASAQVTYLLKGIFKNVISELDDEVSINTVIERIAKDFASYGLEYSVSLFLASLDLRNGHLEYVSSNFPNPIFVESTESRVLPSHQNPLIDATLNQSGHQFESSSMKLIPNSSLFVFTDGAFEFRDPNSGREFGLNRFRRTLLATWQGDWSENLYETLKSANMGQEFEDDITILRVKWNDGLGRPADLV